MLTVQELVDDNADTISFHWIAGQNAADRAIPDDGMAAADLVVLSKTDLVDAAAVERVIALVREELPAQVKVLASDRGRLDLDLILGLSHASEESIHLRESHHDHAEDEEHDHDHDQFDSVVVKLPLVDRERLLACLQGLVEQHLIFRIKGFVALADKPMRLVVHGVGQRFDSYFDRRWQPGETPSTHLVLIGQELDEQLLTRALQAAVIEA